MNKRKHTDIQTGLDDKSNSTIKSKKIKTNIILEQDFINYISVPSLESIALVNIVVKLWNQPDIREEIQEHFFEFRSEYGFFDFDRDENFYEIEKKVSEKLSLLSLPKLLKDEALSIIKPVGLEIVKWINHFDRDYWYCNSMTKHIDSICWTMKGTIDKAKMVELLHFNSKCVKYMYNIACKYCLEDHIVNLWEQMSKKAKDRPFYTKLKYDNHLVAYWTCSIKNELSELLNMIKPTDYNNVYDCNHSIYKNMFTLSVVEGNALAVKYFWRKLTDGEINNYILEWISLAIARRNKKSNEYTDILCFLLSQMKDKEQQREVFQKYSHVVLKSLFLDWPWRKFLLSTIQLMWDYLDSKVYIDILLTVIREIREGRTIEKFLKELWCNSPDNFKTYFIEYIINFHALDVLWNLFVIEDMETIKLILNDANVEEKKQFIFSAIRSRKFFTLIYNKLNLFEILIVESQLSECEIKNLKETTTLEYGDELCRFWIHDDNWQAVEEFLDWGFNSQVQVDTFKRNIVSKIEGKSYLGKLGGGSWSSFERFISWCFNSYEEINQFKTNIAPYHKMESIIFDIIVYKHNFEFAEKLLVWCFPSDKEIDQFKKKLMLSDKGIAMFNRFVSDYKIYDNVYSRWELAVNLTDWYHPFEKEVLIEFKENFEKDYLKCNALIGNDATLESFYFILDSFIHGFRDSDWFLYDLEFFSDLFELDSSCNTGNDDYNKSQCSSSSNTCDDCSLSQCISSSTSDDCSLSQCSSSSTSDDYVNLLMGELINDDYEDIDYNGDVIILLGEILDKIGDSI